MQIPSFQISNFRLTLTSNAPIPTVDVTGAGTLYYTPFNGNRISVFDGAQWIMYKTAQLSGTFNSGGFPALVSGKNYDGFVYDSGSGVLALYLGPAWSSDTARGSGAGTTELTTQDGIYVNKVAISSGPAALCGLYVGTIRASGTNTTEDSGNAVGTAVCKRFVWNMYNRVPRKLLNQCPTSTWSIALASAPALWAALDAGGTGTANRVQIVVGLAECFMALGAYAGVIQGASGTYLSIGIQEDGTGGGAADNQCDMMYRCGDLGTGQMPIAGYLSKIVPLGFHFYQALQWGFGSVGSLTMIGTDTTTNGRLAGLLGTITM